MPASTRPKPAAASRSVRLRPASRGRARASSSSEANASRSSTTPAGPALPNRVLAKAAPNCTEAMPTSSRTCGGRASTRPRRATPAMLASGARPVSARPAAGAGRWLDAAMSTSRTEALARARLYLCTDSRAERGDLAEFLDAVLANGVDIVQLREKNLEAADELAALQVMAQACRRHGRLLAVNDRADLAVAAGADVLHLGQRDLAPAV